MRRIRTGLCHYIPCAYDARIPILVRQDGLEPPMFTRWVTALQAAGITMLYLLPQIWCRIRDSNPGLFRCKRNTLAAELSLRNRPCTPHKATTRNQTVIALRHYPYRHHSEGILHFLSGVLTSWCRS